MQLDWSVIKKSGPTSWGFGKTPLLYTTQPDPVCIELGLLSNQHEYVENMCKIVNKNEYS